jgi:hypothetical protein
VPIAFRKTGTSVVATVPAVTGTPGPEGGGVCAAAPGARRPIDPGRETAKARSKARAAACRLMGALDGADLYGMYIIDKHYM